MRNASFALLAVAILCTAGLAGVVNVPKDYNDDYDEIEQFLEICNVPRVSGYEEKIGAYLMDFAEKHGLYHEMDAVGNVMIDHPGKMQKKIILQSHMDMVAKCDDGFMHDFTRDPIVTVIQDGYITAEHTTLGADDGAGMAIALCALKSSELSGIGFRCIFTVDEEEGTKGAKNVSAEWVKGFDYMINLDEEIEGSFLFGSAGTYRFDVNNTYSLVGAVTTQYRVTISGLLGGHSGDCIGMNRANAILLAMEFLDELGDVQIISFNGGSAANAIPDSCTVTFSYAGGEDVGALLAGLCTGWNQKYSDKSIEAKVETVSGYDKALSVEDSGSLIGKILTIPNGVDYTWKGYVITSSNVGRMTLENGKLSIWILSRSAFEESLDDYHAKFVEIFGDKAKIITKSAAWFGNYDSPIFHVASSIYKDLTGRDPAIDIIHAALECGEFTKLNPNLEIIALGPTILDAHTTSERISIESFHTTKVLVFEMIKKLA